LHVSAVQTPAGVVLAPVMLRSTNSPAPTVTLSVAVHDPLVDAEQESDVFDKLDGVVPTRNVTVMVALCCE
jgi:hypothetical protein